MDRRAGDTGMQHITDNGHRKLREVFLVMTDGVGVEQALRRMGMATIPGIDDVLAREVARDQVGRPRLRMAHHEHVRMHCGKVVDGVQQ